MNTHTAAIRSRQEEFCAITIEREIADLIEEALVAPPRAPSPAEVRASVDRMLAPIARACGITFAPWPEELPGTPALEDHGDLRTAGEPASAARRLENPRPRRSTARDRRSAVATGTYYEAELEAAGRASVRNPCPAKPTSSFSPEGTSSTISKPSHANENVPAWKETKAFGRVIAMNRAVALNDNGEAYAFTLNLSPDTIRRALASPHNGFASWFQKRIARELTKALGRDVAVVFVVDVTRSGRPHLHGSLAVNDNELPKAEQALRRAGGAWKAKCAERQVDTRPAYDADGWASYTTRNLAAARKVVGPSVVAASACLKVDARRLHERLRQSIKSASCW